jgi:hypothetical protein
MTSRCPETTKKRDAKRCGYLKKGFLLVVTDAIDRGFLSCMSPYLPRRLILFALHCVCVHAIL